MSLSYTTTFQSLGANILLFLFVKTRLALFFSTTFVLHLLLMLLDCLLKAISIQEACIHSVALKYTL
ncbi:hypothetical protein Gasu2_37120 [Galdieria sulphuraria]|uniref:Uncharacterized protein n=1 Tax=Galdieria sulphuraria TaxID=130081 RepID=M2Y133_GALSU|nr:uncharacterized protein Gasu_31610 [Galdieria sulphuraria]EME29524.1 hypothetical protein Gasu_31610 [Galdieria sulphuraria]GJD09460.1 hypothetical protein Gasu2_37120 [Galdieria sulphuraria]|eukprot:XP_005706044.1 hypothetical protein Gasu_31610 [Galdieria sulphuraria]